MNSVKTALLLGLLSSLLLLGGAAVGGVDGLILGLLLAGGINFFSYFFSEKLALMMYSAQPVTPQQNPEIYARVAPIVQNLATRMGLPMPKLWVILEASPNAFATGRNPSHASLAFTRGILSLMNDRELEGVIAHELGHVLHRDILTSSVAATLAAAITFLARISSRRSQGLLMFLLAPIAAMLIQMAISRSREFDADQASAKYTGNPDGLMTALTKLQQGVARVPMDAEPSTAHMFILNPFSGGGLKTLFSTHPATEERIARLAAMRGLPQH
jgi:heat shock protein HtpX